MNKSMHSEVKREQQQSCGMVMVFVCFAAVAWVFVTLAQGVAFFSSMLPGFKR